MSDLLLFDHSETLDGVCTCDALAQPPAAHSARLLQDTAQLLGRLLERLGPPGPLEDGHDWDFDLQVEDPQGQDWPWVWTHQGLHWPEIPDGQTRLRLALSIATRTHGQDALDEILQDGEPR